VNAEFAAAGDADVETGSSAIDVRGLMGALRAVTQSGRVTVRGAPKGSWTASTTSGGVELTLDAPAIRIDAASGSGSISVIGGSVDGSVSKRKVVGTIAGGGPLIQVTSRSGSIRIDLSGRDRR
jgi:hypothetical protein